jgi:hypothetical protein
MPVLNVTKSRKFIDEVAILQLLEKHNPVAIYIEKVGSHGQEGRASLWTFAMTYGVLRGLFRSYQYMTGASYTAVAPVTWQAKSFRDMNRTAKGDTKERSIYRAKEIWPDAELETKRGRKLDGRADALHIADYGLTTDYGIQ